MSAEFEYKTIAKFNNMYVYIYNKISRWINNNYNINCSGLHRDAILNRLLFTKTEEEFNDLYNRFLCRDALYPVFRGGRLCPAQIDHTYKYNC